MMKMIKRSERIDCKELLKAIVKLGGKVEKINRYEKWVDVYAGRLLDNMDLYKMTMRDGKITWVLVDVLGRFACDIQLDKAEIIEWLSKNGWTVKVEQYDDDEEEEGC